MSTLQEIEQAIQQLPPEAKWELLHRFQDDLQNDWDQQIEKDAKSGRLDALISGARADIAKGNTRPLNEILGDS